MTILIDPEIGTGLRDCIRQACDVAKQTGETVTIKNFNGSDITVAPSTTPEQAYAEWDADMARRAKEWRESPEGQAAAAREVEIAARCQREAERLLADVPSDLDQLVPWLGEASEYLGHRDVQYDPQALADKLESLGYKRSAHVGRQTWDKRTLGEWIVGQAIDALRHNLPPHPICKKFADEFLTTPAQ